MARALLYAALLAAAGCYLGLEASGAWSDEGLPCDAGDCLEGYSCYGAECIANQSLGLNGGCSKDQQCEDPLICANGVWQCKNPCDNFLQCDSSACGSGNYCAAAPISADTPPLYEGQCLASDRCSSDGAPDCADGDHCVSLCTGVSVCLPGCEIVWQDGGTNYVDTCGSTALNRKFCQPLGKSTDRRLVCLDTHPSAQAEGSACDTISHGGANTCLPGLACIEGICRKHCNWKLADPEPQCGANMTCCASASQDGVDGFFGFCAASCG